MAEVIVEPIIVDDKTKAPVVQRSCCGDIVTALATLKERVEKARLKPIEHRASCLKERQDLRGVFGSVLKGTADKYSDIDFAVELPGDFKKNIEEYVNRVFDRAYYLEITPYGYIAYGSIANVDVSLYYTSRWLDFFSVDEYLACNLTDRDRQKVIEVKE